MIIIKGMEMPTGCSVCELAQWDGETDVCPFCGDVRSFSERHDNCPLHELPPHGDLIDRDALLEIGSDLWVVYDEGSGVDEAFGFSNDVIINAPVVFPAEKGETQ